MLKTKHSKNLLKNGKKVLVGSVNSPVRSFKAVNTAMVFAKKACGPFLWDLDGNKYIDYIMGWGSNILGHAFPAVVSAVGLAIKNGSSFGLSSEPEIQLASMIKRHLKSIERVRFVNSGTEACMTAVRLARAFSGKDKIIKFDGCYHGHFDGLLVKSGSGNLTFGIASGKGILPAYTHDTIAIPFNDVNVVKEVIQKNKHNIACVIVEPVLCNSGVVLPNEGYLKELAAIASQEGIVLIFDEVITGFRLSLKGAQGLFGIKPDLTCLGKIIGGGFPIGAVGGRKEIMELLAPVGPVYQAGTFSGNPVSMVAGISVFESLESDSRFYQRLAEKTRQIVAVIEDEAKVQGIPLSVNSIGSLFSVFFTEKVHSYAEVLNSSVKTYSRFFLALLREGILFPPSPFEACFVSQAHSPALIEKTGNSIKKILKSVRRLK